VPGLSLTYGVRELLAHPLPARDKYIGTWKALES
jgi:hypothetical protein